MSNLNHLMEVMAAEAELTEQLIEVMKMQQQALVNLDHAEVEISVDKQQELLLPIEALEQERLRLTREVWCELTPPPDAPETSIHLTSLLHHLQRKDADRLSMLGSRLHSAVEVMMKVNQANQYLIEHSRRFVRETLRIVTDGHSRQIVDHRI
ncbi:flagellar protein FlgN [Sphingobacteriales bacterium CHB3]|nr:flagellar protein FlgN [Sphingobacteriales bacterium CHB3]